MGLYQLKEFLTLDDVADYLRDKGVYDFDLYSDYDRSRLESWLVGLHRECRISFLYYFVGKMKAKKVVSEIPELTDIEAMQLTANINIAMIKAIEQFEKGETPTNIIPNFKTERLPDIWVNDYIYLHSGILTDGMIPLNRFAIIHFYNNKQFYGDDNIVYKISEENSFIAKKEDLLIPKAELDEIFDKLNNQQQIADLQAENELSDRTEQSYLTTIGLLLELCQNKRFSSQNQIIEAIIDQSIYGQGERTLNERFSKANQALEQVRKNKEK